VPASLTIGLFMIKSADDLIKAIDDGYRQEPKEKARDYIGASGIGTQCDAYQAFSLRGFPNDVAEPKLKRIFKLGHILEDIVVKDIKDKADVRVWEKDGLTGRQYTYEQLGGHVVCHMDGHIETDDGVLRVLEIKSMNDANFKKFMKDGVRISHPKYFSQLQMMMALSGFKESFFIAISKNTSEYHAEIVKWDDFEIAFIKKRIEDVIENKAKKLATDETDWRCRGCFKKSVCWHNAPVPVACNTCQFAEANHQGSWTCTKTDSEARKVCSSYKVYKPMEKGI
tara:strand:+ start:210 stop:1058 length:849 start_codon:yes stop_codon:yes gene_type:complete